MTKWDVGKILQTGAQYWETCAMHAGVQLDVFTAIGERSIDAGEVAAKIHGDLRGTKALLDALAGMELLQKQDDNYRNSDAAKKYLVKTSPSYQGYILMHHANLVSRWSQLADVVKRGKPMEKTARNEQDLENFLMGMFNLAMGIAPDLVKQIDLSGKNQLLDLGGGPGTYAIHFCLKNPGLNGTVFDLQTSERFALRTIEQFGMKERVEFQAGDYLQDEIVGNYDVAWLSHILHAEGANDCDAIVKKATTALKPGGMILIHEFILEEDGAKPLFPTLFALNMLVNTENGRAYRESELKAMLKKAGAKEIRRLPFTGPNDSGIICGLV